jgi:xanthine dehydrogenase accessory factor
MQLWEFIEQGLSQGIRACLIVVVHRQGSSPGKTGFKMAVAADGRLSGSIGGGIMEYGQVELARQMLDGPAGRPMLQRQVHEPDAPEDRSGLLCSGQQVHAFVPLDAGDLDTVRMVLQALETGQGGLLEITPGGLSFRRADTAGDGPGWEKSSDDNWCYREPLGTMPTLYIFGGGHVSVPLSQVGRMLGFRVVVFDDRDGLNTMAGNAYAHEKRRIDYRRAAGLVSGGPDAYVVIMTVSHATDQLLLEQMLPLQLRYLGMIGSKKKSGRILAALRERGATKEQIDRVDSPMGVPLPSVTPAEIAISIAARLIQIKNS